MNDLVVRRLLVDLEQPIPVNWCGGDTFRTAFFNALSFSLPFGEQFFIDAVRNGFAQLPPEKQEAMRQAVQGFIGQEATHRRLHSLYNAQLEKQGMVNVWEPHSRERFKALEGVDVRHWLGITAANEHLTNILAEFMLANDDLMGVGDNRIKTLWLWHASEESEHKHVAFDVYQALSGDQEWRAKWMKRATYLFLREILGQTFLNLKREGTLWKWRTFKGAWSFAFGKRGIVRLTYGTWRRYFRPDFHPNQLHTDASRNWLAAHADQFTPVSVTPA